MKIYPLAVTRPDWETYIKTVQEILGFSPSVGLGETYIKIESPAAYLATLDLENRPLNQLRRGHFIKSSFNHVSFSFICSLEQPFIVDFVIQFPNLQYIYRKPSLLIVTATMTEWYLAVRRGLNVSQERNIREFFHIIYGFFSRYGFQDIWTDLEKSTGKDGFIVMGAKYESSH
jgi:hypothetical protein